MDFIFLLTAGMKNLFCELNLVYKSLLSLSALCLNG